MNKIAFFLHIVAYAAAFILGFDYHYWWAYALIAAAAEGILYLMFYLNNSSIEYLSGHIVRLEHHFPWTERRETTRTVKGEKENVVSYIDHEDEYIYELNTGQTGSIPEKEYERLVRLWPTNKSEIYVQHSHCIEGGGGEEIKWNGDESITETKTYTHRYRNPLKNSYSVNRGQKIKKDEAKALGLFDYPEPVTDAEQQVVLVDPDVYYNGNLDETNRELQRLNAFCGLEKQIHVFILLFPSNAGSQIAFKQRDYWKGCNKNELVVCLGVNEKQVDWCETLSWMDNDALNNEVKDYFRQNPNKSLTEFVKWLRAHLDNWKRVEVKTMKTSSQMSLGSTLYLWISASLISAFVLLCAYWIGGK